MKRLKYYLQCPKCGKAVKLTNYQTHPQWYASHETICCYPVAMRVVSNEQGRLPKFG